MTENTGNNERGIGYIQVRVTSGKGAFPIENASVFVSNSIENKETGIIYSVLSDQSGLTKKLALDAPPLSDSYNPMNKQPYSLYNVKVEKDGFVPVEKMGIQVFPTVTAIQYVDMIPDTDKPSLPYPRNLNMDINSVFSSEND